MGLGWKAACLHLTGFETYQVVGPAIHEVDVLRQAEHRDLAVKRPQAVQTIPQMEARLRTTGGERWVIVARQSTEMPGNEHHILLTLANLTRLMVERFATDGTVPEAVDAERLTALLGRLLRSYHDCAAETAAAA